MNETVHTLSKLLGPLADLVGEHALAELSPGAVLRLIVLAEEAGRAVGSLQAQLAAEAAERSHPSHGSDALAAQKGCANVGELLAHLTRAPRAELSRRIRLGECTRIRHSFHGETLKPQFPHLAQALNRAQLGVDAARLIVSTLRTASTGDGELLDLAEATLVAHATGTGYGTVPAGVPDTFAELEVNAGAWRALLDPDGVLPAEEETLKRRGLSKPVKTKNGLFSYRLNLIPEAAGAFESLLDAHLSPRTRVGFPRTEQQTTDEQETTEQQADEQADAERAAAGQAGENHAAGSATAGGAGDGSGGGDGAAADGSPTSTAATSSATSAAGSAGGSAAGGVELTEAERAAGAGVDPRTVAQKRHDILFGIISEASRSDTAPHLGGEYPTVLVTIREEDLMSGRGAGWIDGTQLPVSVKTVHQMVCTGGHQNVVLRGDGTIVQLSTRQRTFTGQQRRAIHTRDGGCIIPGCRTPARRSEVHHVKEHSRGGPTECANGVLLYWYHHRTIDTSGWQIRMRDGVPWIKAPPWINGYTSPNP